jgi:hypothetical protein
VIQLRYQVEGLDKKKGKIMNTKTKGVLSASNIAGCLNSLTNSWSTRMDYGLLEEGVHRWTFCSVAMRLCQELDDELMGEFDREAFLVACGYYEVANHKCMKDFPYDTTKD